MPLLLPLVFKPVGVREAKTEWMRLCVLLVEKAPELLHMISILPVLKEVHLPVPLPGP